MKKNMATVNERVVAKIRKEDSLRASREKNLRVVYSYRRKGEDCFTDNLILLPKSTELTHEKYLEHGLSMAMLGDNKFKPDNFVGLDLVRVGLYDVHKNTYTPKPIKVVVDVYALACKVVKIGDSK